MHKKEWNRSVEGSALLLRVLRFELFFGDTYKKESGIEKENKTNRNVGLIVAYDNKVRQ